MMIEVPSRPGSSRSVRIIDDELSASEAESTGDEEDEDEEVDEAEFGHDTRSIRSFESMMSGRTGRAKGKRKPNGRMSLTDRLASMPGLSRLSQSQQVDPSKVCSCFYSSPGCLHVLSYHVLGPELSAWFSQIIAAAARRLCAKSFRLTCVVSRSVPNCDTDITSQPPLYERHRR